MTVQNKAAATAEGSITNTAHPSLRELDRPVKLTAANAPGWGSDVVAETLRALEIPYIALNPGASYRGLHEHRIDPVDLHGAVEQRARPVIVTNRHG